MFPPIDMSNFNVKKLYSGYPAYNYEETKAKTANTYLTLLL